MSRCALSVRSVLPNELLSTLDYLSTRTNLDAPYTVMPNVTFQRPLNGYARLSTLSPLPMSATERDT